MLFVYWLGADVGLYMVMIFVKNPRLSYETRATLIKLAFTIDQFPRVTFALILPVGMHLARDLGLYPIPNWLMAVAWIAGILWSALHLAVVRYKGTTFARTLLRINQVYELLLWAVSSSPSAPCRWPPAHPSRRAGSRSSCCCSG